MPFYDDIESFKVKLLIKASENNFCDFSTCYFVTFSYIFKIIMLK